MRQIIQEISLGKKTFILNKKEFISEKEVRNTLQLNEINTNLNQFEFFYNLTYRQFRDEFETEEDRVLFLKNVYLNSYKNLTKLILASQKESIFLKSKEELNFDFDGATLLQNLNLFSIIDVQQLKDQLFDSFNKNPCLVINTQVNTSLQPLQIEIIKGLLQLSCRTQILDLKLRAINITSIFDNSEFYKYDNSLSNYMFDTYVSRIKENFQTYYNSIKEILLESLEQSLENGEEFIDPITNKEIEFIFPFEANNKEQNFLNYLRFLFNQEFITISNNLTNFFKTQISKNGTSALLSNSYTLNQYFLASLPTVSEENIRSVDGYTFAYVLRNEEEDGKSKISLSLSIKLNGFDFSKKYVSLIQSQKIILDTPFTTIENLNESTLNLLKSQIIRSDNFDTLINYVFPLGKMLNFSTISTILLCSNYYDSTNESFLPSLKTCANIHNSVIGNIEEDECETIDSNLAFGFNQEIAKIILQAPVAILKGLVETYDPNIFISKKIKSAAESVGAPDISIIPYSSILMVPPPFGPSIIPTIPGFIYWGISAAETAQNFNQNGMNGKDLDYSGSFDFKNPFKPLC